MSRVATIDIGTNTDPLAGRRGEQRDDLRAGRPRHHHPARPRHWQGWRAGPAGNRPHPSALSGYAVLARVHEAPIFRHRHRGPAPGAQRSRFLCRAAALLDTPVEVIDGEREAALTFLSAKQSFPRLPPKPWWSSTSGAGHGDCHRAPGCRRFVLQPAPWVCPSDRAPHSSRSTAGR